jgi:hypothetical protein
LDQVGAELSAEERAHIQRAVEATEAAVATGAATPLKKAVATLDEATQHLAALLVEKAMRRG